MSGGGPVWAANWYMTRRHIDVDGHALCSEYTKTWPDGCVSGTCIIPPSDSDEVKALPACRLCQRKARLSEPKVTR